MYAYLKQVFTGILMSAQQTKVLWTPVLIQLSSKSDSEER